MYFEKALTLLAGIIPVTIKYKFAAIFDNSPEEEKRVLHVRGFFLLGRRGRSTHLFISARLSRFAEQLKH
jgi:hypothetical protein